MWQYEVSGIIYPYTMHVYFEHERAFKHERGLLSHTRELSNLGDSFQAWEVFVFRVKTFRGASRKGVVCTEFGG